MFGTINVLSKKPAKCGVFFGKWYLGIYYLVWCARLCNILMFHPYSLNLSKQLCSHPQGVDKNFVSFRCLRYRQQPFSCQKETGFLLL